MDPITFELSLMSAFGILIVAVPVMLGLLKLIQVLRTNPEDKIKQEIKNINTDIEQIKKDIEIIEISMSSVAKIGIEHENFKTQLDDLKQTILRLQDKMEKMTDLIIKLVTKD